MIEFTVVDYPSQWPQQCSCGSQKGPMVDTHFERANERVYFCDLCVKRAALARGFIKGAEADKREGALKELAERDRQIQHLEMHNADYSREIGDKNAAINRHLKEIEDLKGRISQLDLKLTGIKQATAA